ncbi:MAG: hypothetical protein ABSG68_26570 [Thermoguttaceae bacterium]
MAERDKLREMARLCRPEVPTLRDKSRWSDTMPPGFQGAAGPDPVPLATAVPVASRVEVSPADPATRLAADQPHSADDEEPHGLLAWLLDLLEDSPYWLASIVFHLVILLLLSMCARPMPEAETTDGFLVLPPETQRVQPIEDLADYEGPSAVEISPVVGGPSAPPADAAAQVFGDPLAVDTAATEHRGRLVVPGADPTGAVVNLELGAFGTGSGSRGDVLSAAGGGGDAALAGRSGGLHGELVAKAGGSPGSERAVAAALKWLAAHQLPDGGWSFQHSLAPACGGQCRNDGSMSEARNAATGLALLPFLGAGQTHRSGRYAACVDHGLQYLLDHLRERSGPAFAERGKRRSAARGADNLHGDSLQDSQRQAGMYSHGIASIALCEAYTCPDLSVTRRWSAGRSWP